ncbi:11947_t:CDS:2, partial [Gigaspora margarita]
EADHGNAIEKLEICSHDIVYNEYKVNYSRIEAADGHIQKIDNR